MIRQAISCDICGTEMQHAHHWFVAYDRGSELRVSSWNVKTRMRSGARHLCGQKCLHKLVDDFMARTLAADSEPVLAETQKADLKEAARSAPRVDGRLTTLENPSAPVRVLSPHVFKEDYESSARLIVPTATEKHQAEVASEPPSYASRAWRSQAWKREQEREQREASSSAGARRRSIA